MNPTRLFQLLTGAARTVSVLMASILTIAASGIAQAQLLPSQGAGAARSQVAMLEVGGTVGAGVIVGFDGGAVYVATAAHITDLAKRPRPTVKVNFEDAPEVARAGEFLEQFEPPDGGDLAVIVVRSDAGLRSFLNGLDFAMLSPVALPPAHAPVTSIGYSGGSAWTRGQSETLLPSEAGALKINSDVLEGQSGGAVYNEAWELIGMAIYRDLAGPTVYARPIGPVLSTLQSWGVPVRLAARPREARVRGADEVARENEQRAQRALRRNLSLRLATQSEQARPSNPVRSLLLAAEALKATREDGLATSAAREAIAKSLAAVGGVGLAGHAETVFAASFSADESLLATASRDGVIRVWNLQDPRAPKCIKVLMERGQGDYIVRQTLAFDMRSKSLISLAEGGRTRQRERPASPKVWRLDTPEFTPSPTSLMDDKAVSTAMVASHKRDLLAVAASSGRLTLFATAQQPFKVRRTLSVPPGYNIRHLFFSKDDSVLLGGADDSRVVLWDLRDNSGTPRAAFDAGHSNRGPFPGKPEIDVLDISDDRAFLITGSSQWSIEGRFGDPSLRVWKLDKLVPRESAWAVDQSQQEPNKFVLAGAFYGNSSHFIGVTPGGALNVWDADRGRFDGKPGDDAPLRKLQVGNYLVAASLSGDRRLVTLLHPQQVSVIPTQELEAGREDAAVTLSGFDTSAELMATSDSARFVVAGSIGGHARLWDLRHADPLGPPVALSGHPFAKGRAIQLSTSGHLAITLRDAALEFWDLQRLDNPQLLYVRRINLRDFGECIVCHIVLSPDERWVAVQDSDPDQSQIIEIAAPAGVRKQFPVASRTWRNTSEIVFSPDSRFVFVKEKPDGLVMYDLRAAAPQREVVSNAETFFTPIFSADGQWVFFKRYVNEYREPVGREHVVGFLAPTEGVRDRSKRIAISGFATSIGRVVFSKSGKWLAVAGADSHPDRTKDDRRVQLWRFNGTTWTKESELDPIEFAADALVFSADENWLLIGSSDITVGDRNVSAKLWDLRSPVQDGSGQRLPDVIWNLKLAKFSPDSRWLVTVSGANAFARLWSLRENRLQFVSRLVGPLPRLNNHWSAVFGPDSNTLVLTTNDDATPFYWRLNEGPVSEGGTAVPNGDRSIADLQISANGRSLTVLNSGGTATGTSGTEGAHITHVDLSTFPREDSHVIAPASARARTLVYREDLGVVVSSGESLVVAVVDPEVAFRRSAEVAGRNMTWEEWVKAGIARFYRPTYPSLTVGPDVIVSETENFARLVNGQRGTEADAMKQNLVDWARRLGNAGACNTLAGALADQGDGRVAMEMADCALRLAPDDPEYHDTRGVALVVLGRHKEAIAEFEAFVEQARGIERFANMIPTRIEWIRRLREGKVPISAEQQ